MEIDKKSNVIEMYGSFFLDESEFALPVKIIQEVVNSPQKLTLMPLAPKYLLGVFNLRGVIVPVLNLKFMLNLNEDGQNIENKKIAIIEYESIRIGLLFDNTGQIFRNYECEKSKFNYANADLLENVISGAIKLDDGKRIVQILDINALVRLEKVPHSKDSLGAKSRDQRQKKQGTRSQCISFFVEKNRLGLGIESIYEIIKLPPLKNSFLSSDICIGMFDLRGDVIPVVDFAVLLKYRNAEEIKPNTDEQRIIIMKMGNQKIGFLIQSVESIVSYYSEELLPIPTLNQERSQIFLGCLSKEGLGDIVLLKTNEILTHTELAKITQGHSNLYRSDTQDVKKEKKLGLKKPYIAFNIDSLFAVEMELVKELIEFPKSLIKPPSISPFVKGMVNLRGKIVTIIDTRVLYGFDQSFELETSKVLIVENMGMSFGLMVDSVENILSFSDDMQIKIPEAIYKTGKTSVICKDVKFAVTIKINNENKNIMILDLNSLTKKIGLEAEADRTAG